MSRFLDALVEKTASEDFDPETVWTPQPTQRQVIESEAKIVLFGGAAGGGKSDLMAGMPLYYPEAHGILFRRNYTDLQSMAERLKELLEPHGGKVTTKKAVYPNKARMLLGQFESMADVRKWRGQANELVFFDELTELNEQAFRLLQAWARSARKMRVRIIAGSNPPMLNPQTGEVAGVWVQEYFGPWLDEEWPNPAKPGEIRWFVRGVDKYTGQERDIEVPSKDKILRGDLRFKDRPDEYVYPESRTFIPSKIKDNVHLGIEYEQALDAMPMEMRIALRDGVWDASTIVEDPYAVVPYSWLKDSHKRWKKRVVAEGNPPRGAVLIAVGVDPARGGQDATVIIKQYRLQDGTIWVATPQKHAGKLTPNGDTAADLIISSILQETGDVSNNLEIRVDAVGIGSSVVDALENRQMFEIVALNGSRKSTKRPLGAAAHIVEMTNQRTEWYWNIREALDPQLNGTAELPPERELTAEIRATRWGAKTTGIQVEDKDLIRQRISRSPDSADALSYSLAELPRLDVSIA